MTRIVSVDREQPDQAILDEAARILLAGGLVAFPTETVYGLGACARDEGSVRRIFEAKGRPSSNPLIVHVSCLDEARSSVSVWPEAAEQLARAFWPGPITLVLPRARWVPNAITAGRETVGVRIPGLPVARKLIETAGTPIAAPSANRSNRVSPTRAEHVARDLQGRVDLILDAGPCSVGLESTVIDLSSSVPTLLRPGAITPEQVEAVLRTEVRRGLSESASASASKSSPGQMDVHYAPRTRTWRVERGEAIPLTSKKSAALVFGEPLPLPEFDLVEWLETPEEASERLYATLHRLDDLGLDAILLVAPPDRPEWRAVRDRIQRAGRPINALPHSHPLS